MQICQFDGPYTDRRINWQEVQTAQRFAPRHPFAHRQSQLESSALNEKRDLPGADRGNPQPIFRKCRLNVAARTNWELYGPGHPPDPGMCIQQQGPGEAWTAQPSASQASSATGSVGW